MDEIIEEALPGLIIKLFARINLLYYFSEGNSFFADMNTVRVEMDMLYHIDDYLEMINK